jgi:hypothetical protein
MNTIKIKSKLFKIWNQPAKPSSIEVGPVVLSLVATRPGGTKRMGALVICVTRGMEVKLALVELFPGAAFYDSQVLADSDVGLIRSTIGRLLGSPNVRLYTHVSLHEPLWPLQVTTDNQTCNPHASCWMSDCPLAWQIYKTGLDRTSVTSMLKKTAKTKQSKQFRSVRTNHISSSFSLYLQRLRWSSG